MARERFVYDRQQGKLVPAWVFYEKQARGVARSDLPAPMLISDSLADVLNPADGKRYDSKSKYYAAVKAKGCEIVGSDAGKTASPRKVDDPTADIVNAMKRHGAL